MEDAFKACCATCCHMRRAFGGRPWCAAGPDEEWVSEADPACAWYEPDFSSARLGNEDPKGIIMDRLGELLGDDADAKAEALEGALAGIGRGWVRCSDRMPPLPEGKPKCYLVALEGRAPDGAPAKLTAPALYSGEESLEGFARAPAGKFCWGPDVFEDPVAWRELPICPFGREG